MIKILNSNYNKENGVSTVEIKTKIGNFTGTSKIQECDKECESSYFGCVCAEIKAVIKYVRVLKRKKQFQLKTLESVFKNIKNGGHKTNNNFNIDSSPEMRCFLSIIENIRKEISALKAEEKRLSETLLENIDSREVAVNAAKAFNKAFNKKMDKNR